MAGRIFSEANRGRHRPGVARPDPSRASGLPQWEAHVTVGRSVARGRPAFAETQRAAILRLLIAARGGWVPLTEILALGIAQYGARILEARRMGFRIENRTERVDGARHSWSRLLNPPAPWSLADPTPAHDAPESNLGGWYESTTGKPRPNETALADDLPLFAAARR
jgi:hypothetical protein